MSDDSKESIDRLTRLFTDWHVRFSTHMNRYLGLTGKHVRNMNAWANFFVRPYPSKEMFAQQADDLYVELGDIFDQFREVMTDISDDMQFMKDNLSEFQKDIKEDEQD